MLLILIVSISLKTKRAFFFDINPSLIILSFNIHVLSHFLLEIFLYVGKKYSGTKERPKTSK